MLTLKGKKPVNNDRTSEMCRSQASYLAKEVSLLTYLLPQGLAAVSPQILSTRLSRGNAGAGSFPKDWAVPIISQRKSRQDLA